MAAPVLLLDAAWRIDRVIDAERACELLVMNRAVPASEEIATVMHSPSLTVEIPSVVARLGVLHPCELRPPTYSPRRVRLRDGHLCQFVISGQPCARRGDSVDHLLPRSLGGNDSWLNVVAACRAHNGAKSHRTMEQMHHLHGWSLKRRRSCPRARRSSPPPCATAIRPGSRSSPSPEIAILGRRRRQICLVRGGRTRSRTESRVTRRRSGAMYRVTRRSPWGRRREDRIDVSETTRPGGDHPRDADDDRRGNRRHAIGNQSPSSASSTSASTSSDASTSTPRHG